MTQYQRQRLWLILGVVFCLSASAALLFMAFRDNIVFFFTPSECYARGLTLGQTMRIGGLVKEGSVKHMVQDKTPFVLFDVTDGKSSVRISYTGILPDLFREGQGIVSEGTFEKEHGVGTLFRARTVLAKHDETYRPPTTLDASTKEALGKSLRTLW